MERVEYTGTTNDDARGNERTDAGAARQDGGDNAGVARWPWPNYLSSKMNRPSATRTPARAATTPPRAKAAPPVDPSLEIPLKLWVVLARAYAEVARHVEEDVAKHDLTPMEFGILEVLHHKGPLLLGEIQRKVLVTSGGITYLVDRLVEKGLVKRQECPDDRRARYAVLTPAGSALIKRIFPAHARTIARALSGLTMSEQAEATELVRRLGLAAAAASGR